MSHHHNERKAGSLSCPASLLSHENTQTTITCYLKNRAPEKHHLASVSPVNTYTHTNTLKFLNSSQYQQIPKSKRLLCYGSRGHYFFFFLIILMNLEIHKLISFVRRGLDLPLLPIDSSTPIYCRISSPTNKQFLKS